MGLAIVRAMLEAHGGRIKLDTSKNRFFGRLRVNSRRIKAI